MLWSGRPSALALLPGAYGALKIDGVLLLNPGRYVVSSVTMGDFARMRAITGNVKMSIAETLRTGRHAVINPILNFRRSTSRFRSRATTERARPRRRWANMDASVRFSQRRTAR